MWFFAECERKLYNVKTHLGSWELVCHSEDTMVNGKWHALIKCFTIIASHSPCTHIFKAVSAMQGSSQLVREQLGSGVSLRDSSTLSYEERGIELATLPWPVDPLYLLSHCPPTKQPLVTWERLQVIIAQVGNDAVCSRAPALEQTWAGNDVRSFIYASTIHYRNPCGTNHKL